MQAKSIAPLWYSIDFSLMSWNGWQYWREELPICRKTFLGIALLIGNNEVMTVCMCENCNRQKTCSTSSCSMQPTNDNTNNNGTFACSFRKWANLGLKSQSNKRLRRWVEVVAFNSQRRILYLQLLHILNREYTYRIALWYRAERLQRGNFCMDPCLIDILINISFNTVCNGVCMELPYMDVNTLESRSCLWFSQL